MNTEVHEQAYNTLDIMIIRKFAILNSLDLQLHTIPRTVKESNGRIRLTKDRVPIEAIQDWFTRIWNARPVVDPLKTIDPTHTKFNKELKKVQDKISLSKEQINCQKPCTEFPDGVLIVQARKSLVPALVGILFHRIGFNIIVWSSDTSRG